jgi:catechol 2,3-dioxygenase-like lactoylglutathione lyase family enzyme
LTQYVDPANQLIVELYVKSLVDSINFYERLGFQLIRNENGFAELKWEDSRLFLEEESKAPPRHSDFLAGNIRIMVPDVDVWWALAGKMDVRVVKSLGNREYGLRDFTIAGPDGLGLRFATPI